MLNHSQIPFKKRMRLPASPNSNLNISSKGNIVGIIS